MFIWIDSLLGTSQLIPRVQFYRRLWAITAQNQACSWPSNSKLISRQQFYRGSRAITAHSLSTSQAVFYCWYLEAVTVELFKSVVYLLCSVARHCYASNSVLLLLQLVATCLSFCVAFVWLTLLFFFNSWLGRHWPPNFGLPEPLKPFADQHPVKSKSLKRNCVVCSKARPFWPRRTPLRSLARWK